MDPQALIERLAIMISRESSDEIQEAYIALLEWLGKGGYVPNCESAIKTLNGE